MFSGTSKGKLSTEAAGINETKTSQRRPSVTDNGNKAKHNWRRWVVVGAAVTVTG
jgi:hypothetical protein